LIVLRPLDDAAKQGLDWGAMRTAAVMEMRAEDLSDAVDVALGDASFQPYRFCFAPWLVARATDQVAAPSDADLVGHSVRIEGTWERDGELGPLEFDTWWPEGIVMPVEAIGDASVLAEGKRTEPSSRSRSARGATSARCSMGSISRPKATTWSRASCSTSASAARG
jgi:hypothetical protein